MAFKQALSAQKMYNARSSSYDDSHHPALAADFVAWARLQPGQHVLDLACGTGLITLLAKKAVGHSGTVTGIDISDSMMALAKEKAEREGLDIKWLFYDIADLETCEGLREGGYDLITCCSALVLLDDPVSAVREWMKLLKPGGKFMTDVPTEDCYISGLIIEEVGKEVGIEVPWNRLWVRNKDSLRQLMEEAGLVVERCWTSEEYGLKKEYAADSGEAVFDKTVESPMLEWLRMSESRERAKEVFKEKFAKRVGATGVVTDDTHLYVAIGRRA